MIMECTEISLLCKLMNKGQKQPFLWVSLMDFFVFWKYCGKVVYDWLNIQG